MFKYSGQPKRHLLTTGWSLFVGGKRLAAGDSVRTGGSVANDEILGFAKPLNDELTLDNISRGTFSSLPDKVVGVTSLPSEDSASERQEELSKEKEEQAKKKQSIECNKDVALEETTNATAADAQQQARAIALDKQQQLCKTSEALPVLASASINLYHSMMDKEGNGEQDIMKAYKAAHEEIDDSSDGASSALINRVYDEKVTSEELDSATASTTGVHLEKTPMGPTPSSSPVGSSMVITLENKASDQLTVSSSILSSVSNLDMSLVGDDQNM
ncbi:LETM1-like protein [Artemisia annua]|uniref:LETM1-like protein n=1 Tax=Artemisia annua TaxID=35608 RepID=A0A2U1NS55_ARTAN|nr:LETM1-like protein [Artemisia annua]